MKEKSAPKRTRILLRKTLQNLLDNKNQSNPFRLRQSFFHHVFVTVNSKSEDWWKNVDRSTPKFIGSVFHV
jgi:hypothetical protein